jgi:hypothetical protein
MQQFKKCIAVYVVVLPLSFSAFDFAIYCPINAAWLPPCYIGSTNLKLPALRSNSTALPLGSRWQGPRYSLDRTLDGPQTWSERRSRHNSFPLHESKPGHSVSGINSLMICQFLQRKCYILILAWRHHYGSLPHKLKLMWTCYWLLNLHKQGNSVCNIAYVATISVIMRCYKMYFKHTEIQVHLLNNFLLCTISA